MKKACTIKETAKIIICINCAAISCNADFDRGQAISLSGLKEKEYIRQKELFESLLDLSKKISMDEICAQLGISDVLKNDAAQLFNEYKKRNAFLSDVENPCFATMAVYQSCKLKGKKDASVHRSKLMQLSKLNNKAWKHLEDEWNKWIEEYHSSIAASNSTNSSKWGSKSDKRGKIFHVNNFFQVLRNIALISLF